MAMEGYMAISSLVAEYKCAKTKLELMLKESRDWEM